MAVRVANQGLKLSVQPRRREVRRRAGTGIGGLASMATAPRMQVRTGAGKMEDGCSDVLRTSRS